MFGWLTGLFLNFFNGHKKVALGIYGSPNAGKSTLANQICLDFSGSTLGTVSQVPHETRKIQKREKLMLKTNSGKKMILDIMDMPGIATKVDYRDFMQYGIDENEARERAKEATQGIIESVKSLEDVNAALIVLDSTQDPYTQINLTLIGNLEARKIPFLLLANKTDLPESDVERVKKAFPQYFVLPISARERQNLEGLYEEMAKRLK